MQLCRGENAHFTAFPVGEAGFMYWYLFEDFAINPSLSLK